MTLSSTSPRVQYDGDGSTASFSVTFTFWDGNDLLVILTGSDGVETNWVRGTQYTVTGGDGATGAVIVSVSPTDYTPANGETLTIKSNLPDAQNTSLPLGGKLPSTSIESQFDRNVRLIQQTNERIDRAVLAPASDPASSDLELPVASVRATKLLAFDANGNVVVSGLTLTEMESGATGPQGPTGATGPTGADGDDGVITELASQAEAQAGTNNTKGMTPQRTAEAIAALASSVGQNIIINGGFRTNQRVYSSAAILASGVYGHDRWKAGAAGGDYSFTQLKSSTQITIASGKTLIQVIEDINVEGGTYTLSWEGTAQARAGVDTATPAGAYADSPLTISSQTAGTVMSVEFDEGTLGKVKLETGSAATAFVPDVASVSLTKCQRYYQKTFPQATAPVQNSGDYNSGSTFVASSSGRFALEWTFATVMRAQPTITTYNPGASNASARNSTDSSDTAVGSTRSDRHVSFYPTSVDGTDANDNIYIQATAESEL